MKKSKLLIPALSVASVGAVVAPMVTSCANKSGITFQAVKDGKWNKDYKPMTGPTKLTYKNYQAFVDGLTSTINGNPKIWADDVLNVFLKNAWQSENPGVTTMNISVSNTSITNKTIDLTDTPLKSFIINSFISFDIKIDTTEVESTNEKTTNYQTLEYHVQNMPYTFYDQNETIIRETGETLKFTTPVAIPSFLTLMNSTSTSTGFDILSYLTFIESGFSFSFAIKNWDSDGDVHANFDFTIDNVEILVRVMSDTTGVWSLFSSYLAPLRMPVQSNYFKNAKISA